MSRSQDLLVELRPSLLLAGAVALVHVCALAAAALSLHGGSLVLVATGILLSGAGALAAALQRGASAARGLELRGDGHCAWRDGGGRWHDASDRRLHFVSPWLIVVALRTKPSRPKWITVLPDSSDRESLRRLRAWLRGTEEKTQEYHRNDRG